MWPALLGNERQLTPVKLLLLIREQRRRQSAHGRRPPGRVLGRCRPLHQGMMTVD